MAYQTGTVVQVNELLDAFATFLAANGWTVLQNYKRPITAFSGEVPLDPPPGTEPQYWWRTARNLVVQKGDVTVIMEDFYMTPGKVYGNFFGGLGPGIAASITTGGAAGLFDADFPDFASYDMGGPAFFAPIALAGGDTPMSSSGVFHRTVVMPLPSIVGQGVGTWKASTHVMSPVGVTNFPGNFGVPGGAADPCKYWFMTDATNDNVIMVILRDRGELASIPKTTYLYFGTLKKGGDWAGGRYVGASHGNVSTFTNNASPSPYEGFQITRFGPPGTTQDGNPSAYLDADVDTFVGKYLSLSNSGDSAVTTGRNMTSTTSLTDGAGLVDNGVMTNRVQKLRSTLTAGAPMWPTYWLVQRDNGLWSILGSLPHIFAANTFGIAPGTETVDKGGNPFLIFDGFAIRKVP